MTQNCTEWKRILQKVESNKRYWYLNHSSELQESKVACHHNNKIKITAQNKNHTFEIWNSKPYCLLNLSLFHCYSNIKPPHCTLNFHMFHKQNKPFHLVKINYIDIYIVLWIELHLFPTQCCTTKRDCFAKETVLKKFLFLIRSALPNIKYICEVLFSRQRYFLRMLPFKFSHKAPL